MTSLITMVVSVHQRNFKCICKKIEMGGRREPSPITSSPKSAKMHKRVEGFFLSYVLPLKR